VRLYLLFLVLVGHLLGLLTALAHHAERAVGRYVHEVPHMMNGYAALPGAAVSGLSRLP
jgi:hypothetical protein